MKRREILLLYFWFKIILDEIFRVSCFNMHFKVFNAFDFGKELLIFVWMRCTLSQVPGL